MMKYIAKLVREEHPRDYVPPGTAQLLNRCALALNQRLLSFGSLLLHLLRGLPKEQVR